MEADGEAGVVAEVAVGAEVNGDPPSTMEMDNIR